MLKQIKKIQLSYENGCLTPDGDLTIESVPSADKQLKAHKSKFTDAVSIDLSNATKNDTAGLAWLVNLKAELQQKDIGFELKNVPETLKKLSKLSDADTLLEIE